MEESKEQKKNGKMRGEEKEREYGRDGMRRKKNMKFDRKWEEWEYKKSRRTKEKENERGC